MVVYALQYVSRHFSVKISHGQAHQFCQIVGNKRYVHPHAYVQQYPSPYESYRCTAYYKYKLCQQHKVYKAYILICYTEVDNRLCEEREYQLQHRPHGKPYEQLHDESLVRLQVREEEREGFSVCRFVVIDVIIVKLWCRLKTQCHACFVVSAFAANPAAHKLLLVIFNLASGRVCYVKESVSFCFPYPV